MQKVSATANEVTTTSEDDYVLGIYGNANEDDTIDMGDVVYIKLAIFGKKSKTELCDAKYDERINVLDVIQTKLIILGKEKELTFEDAAGAVITVNKPVERIIVDSKENAEIIRIVNVKDKVVGVAHWGIANNEIRFPELSKLPYVRDDYEAMLSLNVDLLMTQTAGKGETARKKLPGVAVVFLGMYYPVLSNPDGSPFTDGERKLGYILDREEEAEEYINWRIGWINEIKSRTEGLSEDEKPRVFITGPGICEGQSPRTPAKVTTLPQICILAGGKNIAEDDIPKFVQSGYNVDLEWVIEQNPDFILVHVVRYTGGGKTGYPSHGYDEDDPTEVKEMRDTILNRPELANVNAVKTGNVYITGGNFRNDATGGVTGAAYQAKLFHPDLFEDLDPEAIHQEFLELQHFDYDLDEHGVFLYPPIITGEGKLAGIPDRYYDSIIAQP
jgi:iron complex transport system substrate-binding protein